MFYFINHNYVPPKFSQGIGNTTNMKINQNHRK